MADLEFSGTPQQRAAQGEAFMRRIHSDFYGNGRKGLMERTLTFIDGWEAVEEERERAQRIRHEENTEKLDLINARIARKSLTWTIAGVLVAIAALAVGVLAVLVTVKVVRTSDVRTLLHSNNAVYSSNVHATAGEVHF